MLLVSGSAEISSACFVVMYRPIGVEHTQSSYTTNLQEHIVEGSLAKFPNAL